MGGAQAAFGRFWVAGRIGSWSVLVFGAKWIISGRRRVRCGRPACITNTCLWHNLRLMHRFEDYRGTRIINLPRLVTASTVGGANPGDITGPQQTYLCIG